MKCHSVATVGDVVGDDRGDLQLDSSSLFDEIHTVAADRRTRDGPADSYYYSSPPPAAATASERRVIRLRKFTSWFLASLFIVHLMTSVTAVASARSSAVFASDSRCRDRLYPNETSRKRLDEYGQLAGLLPPSRTTPDRQRSDADVLFDGVALADIYRAPRRTARDGRRHRPPRRKSRRRGTPFSPRRRFAAAHDRVDVIRDGHVSRTSRVGRSTPPTRIVLDFDRSIGDRLYNAAVEEETSGSRHSSPSVPPFRRLTAVDPSTVASLSLGACQIRTLPVGLLAGMARLEQLAMWANGINRLPIGLFDNTTRLRDVLLWNNRFDRLDATMFLPSLASHNHHHHHHHHQQFDSDDRRDSPLRLLDLDRNRISSIGSPMPTGGGKNRGGDSSSSATLATDEPWRRFPELRILRLAGNRIGSLTAGSFRGLSGLRSLSLDANGLAYVHSEAFNGLTSLVRLSLADNSLVFVPDGLFSGLGLLAELTLARNRIEHVWSRTFAGLARLRRLDLSSNRLSQIPDDTFGPSTTPRLDLLRLDDNRLRTLRRCVFPPPRPSTDSPATDGDQRLVFPVPVDSDTTVASWSRRILSLIGNTGLLCDCRLAWLAQVVEKGALRTVWGSCDVQMPAPTSPTMVDSSSSSTPDSSDSNWFSIMSAQHRSPISVATSSSLSSSFRSPVQTAVVRGLFSTCSSSTTSVSECRT